MQIERITYALLILFQLGVLTPIVETKSTYYQDDRKPDALLGDSAEFRNGLVDEKKRWPDKKVNYKIDAIFDTKRVEIIESAMKSIENVSCIRFYPATPHMKIYLNIIHKNNKCNSKVGFQGGIQQMRLDRNKCMRKGTIMHELMHILGFYHQTSASDRDDFVNISMKNVKHGKEHNFRKYNASTVTGFGIPYDYDSIMHYTAFAFSKGKGLKTIIPAKGKTVIGQRDHLSKGDIAKLNIMYKCKIGVKKT